MAESAEAVYALAATLEHLGAPWGLPEDWIILCDNDDLRHMPRTAAKKLLAKAKKETARRWLLDRFDPSEMDLELSDDSEGNDGSEAFDDGLLKQRAINSIDDVVSTVKSLREVYAGRAIDPSQMAAHQATVAARIECGYPKERPSRTDCFDEDVRHQCRRIINEIYSGKVRSPDR
ncbi:GIY-YIG nuclease family protein (plasmid) [Bradyrhizobium guangxiense]